MFTWLSDEPLAPDQLNRLLDHKYKSEGESCTDFLFKKFWATTVQYIPLYVAPNTLTLVGFVANVIAVLFLFINGASSFGFILFSLCVFLYQTSDALDGLQARRTGMCSQLGELFDHGFDALSSCILPFGVILAMEFTERPVLLFLYYCGINSLFYISHWKCYVTGILTFDRIGVTEGLLCTMILPVLSAVFDTSIWKISDPVFGIELRAFHECLFGIVFTMSVVHFYGIISKGGCGKYGTTVANTSILFPGCPLALVWGLAAVIALRSPYHIYEQHPCSYLFLFGIVQSKISQRLVIAHMTKSVLNLFDTVMIGPCILLINQYFSCPLNEIFLLYFACLLVVADIFYYDVVVCIQLASFLNIYIFHVGKPSVTRVYKSSSHRQKHQHTRMSGSTLN